jgi:hypothetical protein
MRLVPNVALAAMLAIGAGCQAPAAPTAPLATDIFEDVPAPRGAAYLDRRLESFSYRAATFRCGLFAYDWHGSESDVIRFYKETMTTPPYSWTFSGQEGAEEGSTRLLFVKGDDRCTVDVDRVPRPGIENRDVLSLVVRVNYRR